MRISKHVLVAALCIMGLMGVFALSACSSTPEADSEQASVEETEAEVEVESEEPAGEPVELQIFAANSLSKAMDEVQALYATEHPEVTFADTQYEASGTLNEMLNGGAYADILITASKSTMDTAVEEGYVDATTRFDMFTNDLVIVAGADSALDSVELEDLASGNYTFAVGDASVPAGNYAKQSLTTTDPQCWISADGAIGKDCSGQEGTFEGTPLEGLVTEGSSVGNVCSYANSGDVDVAMVYSSDVYRFGGVKIVSVVADDTHKAIVYPAAVCADSEQAQAASEFLEWAFTNEDAVKIWQEWGFELA